MPMTIEEEMNLLTEKGYMTEGELKREAYRALLRERKELRVSIAIERYKKEEDITLNRAAEIAGITTEEMKHILHERGITIRRGFTTTEEREEKAGELAKGA